MPRLSRMFESRAFTLRVRTLVAAGLFAALAAGCAVNPATGRHEFTLVSAGQELAMGQEGYTATVAEYGQYDDVALAAYVDTVGHRLARVSERPDLQWHFTVLDDPMVNAFAMPGGYIYITRGILAHLNSEAQLAGVLGHEIGHVTARHSAKQITQQQIAGLGLAVAGAFSTTVQQYSGTAQQALGLLMLKYSRDDETQADELGIRYATAAGYDPREIPATYAMLKRVSQRGGGSALPFYLATHPDPGNREERTGALAAQAAAGKTNLLVRAHAYLDHLRGLAFGEDPRGGWFDGLRFTQPRLGFQMDMPKGWKTQNGRSALTAVAPDNGGQLQVTIAKDAGTLSPAEYVAALKRDGRIQGPMDYTALSGFTGGLPCWLGEVYVLQAGDPAARPSQVMLHAMWVRIAPDRMLQLLGKVQVDVKESGAPAYTAVTNALVNAMTSTRPPLFANAEPDRVHLKVVNAPAPFRSLLEKYGGGAISADDAAILNNVALDQSIAGGQWLKIVDAGHRR